MEVTNSTTPSVLAAGEPNASAGNNTEIGGSIEQGLVHPGVCPHDHRLCELQVRVRWRIAIENPDLRPSA